MLVEIEVEDWKEEVEEDWKEEVEEGLTGGSRFLASMNTRKSPRSWMGSLKS